MGRENGGKIEFVIDMHSQIHYTPSCNVGSLSAIAQNVRDIAQRFLYNRDPWNPFNCNSLCSGMPEATIEKVTMFQQEEVSETHNERSGL